ncbi:MAG: hypothetical protein NT096_00575 [Proteobacteria bacterium]|nr:hypothetical protein [Pseudomonadota bacterium]
MSVPQVAAAVSKCQRTYARTAAQHTPGYGRADMAYCITDVRVSKIAILAIDHYLPLIRSVETSSIVFA